jgi:hypothetical protein
MRCQRQSAFHLRVFLIDIIEAETDPEAIEKAHQSRDLKRRTCPIELYEIPYYKTGLRR